MLCLCAGPLLLAGSAERPDIENALFSPYDLPRDLETTSFSKVTSLGSPTIPIADHATPCG